MMFGLNPKSLHEIEEALAQPNCTVDELLKCAGVTSQFRNGNAMLINFLLEEKNAKRIFEIIHTDPNRATQKSLLALFQTSNTALHRLFADNLIITEYAINILESTSKHANFSVGIISRVISRAFDLWPDDMSEVFRISKTIYKTLISHIDNVCVFHSVQDMITDTHKGLWLFMWHSFRALASACNSGQCATIKYDDNQNDGENNNGKEKEGENNKIKERDDSDKDLQKKDEKIDEQKEKNDEKINGVYCEYKLWCRSALIDEDIKVDPALITDLHKDHIINILRLFFKLKLATEAEFAENVMRFIIDQRQEGLSTLYFSLALSLQPNEVLMKRAANVILKCDDFTDPIIEKALNYISYCVKMIENTEFLVSIIHIVLTHQNSSNFVMNALKGLVITALENAGIKENLSKSAIIEEVKKVIKLEFNRTKEEDNPMHFSFLISISIVLCGAMEEKEEKEAQDEQWNVYKKEVVDPWKNDEEYNQDFTFDVSAIDQSKFSITEFKD